MRNKGHLERNMTTYQFRKGKIVKTVNFIRHETNNETFFNLTAEISLMYSLGHENRKRNKRRK